MIDRTRTKTVMTLHCVVLKGKDIPKETEKVDKMRNPRNIRHQLQLIDLPWIL